MIVHTIPPMWITTRPHLHSLTTRSERRYRWPMSQTKTTDGRWLRVSPHSHTTMMRLRKQLGAGSVDEVVRVLVTRFHQSSSAERQRSLIAVRVPGAGGAA